MDAETTEPEERPSNWVINLMTIGAGSSTSSVADHLFPGIKLMMDMDWSSLEEIDSWEFTH